MAQNGVFAVLTKSLIKLLLWKMEVLMVFYHSVVLEKNGTGEKVGVAVGGNGVQNGPSTLQFGSSDFHETFRKCALYEKY